MTKTVAAPAVVQQSRYAGRIVPTDAILGARPMEKFLPACLAAGVIGLSVSSASAALSAADREFAMKAASGGLAEVQAA